MKKIFLFISICFLIGKNGEAQNLVPNPSFEEYDLCPDGDGQVWKAESWYIVEMTPDYFNACCTNQLQGFGVPNNILGYRNAATGNAYCGFVSYVDYSAASEKFGVELISPLIIGTKYYVSFNLSSVNSHLTDANGACNKIGSLFSTVKYDLNNFPPINNFCQFYSDSIVTDTIGWIKIKGSMIADSAYRYLTLGDFFDSFHIDTLSYWHNPGNYFLAVYYYIDDVCVSPDSLACDLNPDGIYSSPEKNSITLSPNPTQNNFHLTMPGANADAQIQIYNLLGQCVRFVNPDSFRIDKSSNATIDVSDLPSGIYVVRVISGNSVFTQKLVKN